jgi:hypothetical protein
MSWGGGARRKWQGSVVASEGVLSEPRSLGLEADAPNELITDDRSLRFAQRVPVSFDGLDFHVRGPANATLTIEFSPLDDVQLAKRVEVRLADFQPMVPFVHESLLDDQQNRLQLQRAPGDRLRVRFDRDSLVFGPNEEFVIQAYPHALGLPEGTTLRCTIQLQTQGEDAASWKEQHDLRVDAKGAASLPGPTRIPLPADEGVYEVLISLYPRRLADAIGRFGEVLVPSKPLMQRKVQLVVISPQSFPAEVEDWRLVEELDSANPKWWAKWVWLPPLKKLPGVSVRGPLGDQPLRAIDYLGRQLKEIGPGGWHAAPIPIAEEGEPHVLELEYPTSIRQTLGISILEQDAQGQIGTEGVDSGIDVPGGGSSAPGMERHRIIFWPRTRTPWLLLTNRRADAPAAFGTVRILAGPAVLPSEPARMNPPQNGRLVAALLDKPLFSRNFGAPNALDEPSGRSLADWGTFYWGAVRFAEYLKHTGYNAAIVPVLGDGTSFYPTRLLDTTPKSDNGTFFLSGQDPIPKDVLELLLRVFDREGLTLIPSVQFGTPLRELESLRREQDDPAGVLLLGALPNEPRPIPGSWVETHARKGLASYYNPLDQRVQTAMRRVVSELLVRCSTHRSFGGLSLQLVPYGYAQLPDDNWALDDATFARFLREARLSAAPDERQFGPRLSLVRGKYREAWLAWRAVHLTRFYQQLREDVARSSPTAQLYLDMHELMAGRVVQSQIRPQLPERDEFREALLRHGLDTTQLMESPGIVLLRPHRVAPLTSIPAQGANLELEFAADVSHCFRSAGTTGMVAFHEPQPLRVPGFDQASPFGPERTYTRLLAQFSAAGAQSRAQLVRGLAALDSTVLASGGWMLPLGQEDALRPLFRVLGNLPAEKFTDVKGSDPPPNISVRTLTRNDQTYIYIANATGLRANVELHVPKFPPQASVYLLTERAPPSLTSTGGDRWAARLDAYDVLAFVITSAGVAIADWRVEFDGEDVANLRRIVPELQSRVDGLRKQQPLAVLENPGFESPPVDGQIRGWSAAASPEVAVRMDDRTARTGKTSLHVRSAEAQGIARLRSNLFPLPKTGRLAVLARMRTSDASRQPPVRLAIEGTLADGTPFYFASELLGVAAQPGVPARTLPSQWAAGSDGEFLFPFVHLPAGMAGQVRVGLDLLGPGELWIDDVEVFDLYFQKDERDELVKKVNAAALELKQDNYSACQQILQQYWPQFVLEFGDAPPRLSQPDAPAADSPAAVKSAERVKPDPAEKRSPWLPRIPWPRLY